MEEGGRGHWQRYWTNGSCITFCVVNNLQTCLQLLPEDAHIWAEVVDFEGRDGGQSSDVVTQSIAARPENVKQQFFLYLYECRGSLDISDNAENRKATLTKTMSNYHYR